MTLLVVDLEDTTQYLEVRGDVELTATDALEHIDSITRAYLRLPKYYGYVFPEERLSQETRVICRIKAKKLTLFAIHR